MKKQLTNPQKGFVFALLLSSFGSVLAMDQSKVPGQQNGQSNAPQEQDNCSVCLAEKAANEPLIHLECSHSLHLTCLLNHVLRSPKSSTTGRATCPMCRADAQVYQSWTRNGHKTTLAGLNRPLTSIEIAQLDALIGDPTVQISTREFVPAGKAKVGGSAAVPSHLGDLQLTDEEKAFLGLNTPTNMHNNTNNNQTNSANNNNNAGTGDEEIDPVFLAHLSPEERELNGLTQPYQVVEPLSREILDQLTPEEQRLNGLSQSSESAGSSQTGTNNQMSESNSYPNSDVDSASDSDQGCENGVCENSQDYSSGSSDDESSQGSY